MRNECSSLKLIQAKLQRLSAYLQVYVLYAIVYVHSLFFPSLITMFETFPCVLIHSVITSIQHDLKPATTKAWFRLQDKYTGVKPARQVGYPPDGNVLSCLTAPSLKKQTGKRHLKLDLSHVRSKKIERESQRRRADLNDSFTNYQLFSWSLICI